MKTLILIILFTVNAMLCNAQEEGAYAIYNEYLNNNILTKTNYGLTFKKTGNESYIRIGKNSFPVGSNYVHIFFDEYGNLVSDNIPNGVPWVNYVIHVIYKKTDNQYYSIVQTAGKISGEIFIKNTSTISAKTTNTAKAEWAESTDVLRATDNSDITFQLIKTTVNETGAIKNTIGTYTIPLAGYFSASVDFGVLNSTLSNPSYSLVNSVTVPGTQVVKATGNGNRVMTTFMGTIYFSPIVFLEKTFFGTDVPEFKLKGRSAVADYNLIERVYPTFGLSVNEKTFQNIFYGLNWEIIHGGSLFVGLHMGKISYFESSPNFKFENTPITSDEFNLKTNNRWSTKLAIGATIDLKLILGLVNSQIK